MGGRGVILGRLGAVLEPAWGRLGAVLGPSCAVLGRLGASWSRLGPVLGPSWDVLGHLEDVLNLIFVAKGIQTEAFHLGWHFLLDLCLICPPKIDSRTLKNH